MHDSKKKTQSSDLVEIPDVWPSGGWVRPRLAGDATFGQRRCSGRRPGAGKVGATTRRNGAERSEAEFRRVVAPTLPAEDRLKDHQSAVKRRVSGQTWAHAAVAVGQTSGISRD